MQVRIDLVDEQERRLVLRIGPVGMKLVQPLQGHADPAEERAHSLADLVERDDAVARLNQDLVRAFRALSQRNFGVGHEVAEDREEPCDQGIRPRAVGLVLAQKHEP
jgi:hypothetical protein